MSLSFKVIHFLREKTSAQRWTNEIQCGLVMYFTVFYVVVAIRDLNFVPRKLKLTWQAVWGMPDHMVVNMDLVVCVAEMKYLLN